MKLSLTHAMIFLAGALTVSAHGGELKSDDAISRGKKNFETKVYAIAAPFLTLSETVFDNLSKVWPAPLQEEFNKADAPTQRKMRLQRYGLHEVPEKKQNVPLGFVLSSPVLVGDVRVQRMEATCLLCHAGSVAGQTLVGRANSTLDLGTLFEDIIGYRMATGDFSDLTPVETQLFKNSLANLGATANPHASRGAIDVWGSGHLTLMFRDKDMEVQMAPQMIPFPTPTDMDPPAWWNTHLKSHLYSDGFIQNLPRTPILAGLSFFTSGAEIRSYESDFIDNLQYWESIQPPKWTANLKQDLVSKGSIAFKKNCSGCHGNYDQDGNIVNYPNRVVPLETIKTDPVRVTNGLSIEYRQRLKESWIGYSDQPGNESDIKMTSTGYYAPPLKGIWATAPYFHNGSVPNLYGVLHPTERPTIWKMTDQEGYDFEKVGLAAEPVTEVPAGLTGPEQRFYYDTRLTSKSNAGHLFVNRLTEPEKEAVLEYLKTL